MRSVQQRFFYVWPLLHRRFFFACLSHLFSSSQVTSKRRHPAVEAYFQARLLCSAKIKSLEFFLNPRLSIFLVHYFLRVPKLEIGNANLAPWLLIFFGSLAPYLFWLLGSLSFLAPWLLIFFGSLAPYLFWLLALYRIMIIFLSSEKLPTCKR